MNLYTGLNSCPVCAINCFSIEALEAHITKVGACAGIPPAEVIGARLHPLQPHELVARGVHRHPVVVARQPVAA